MEALQRRFNTMERRPRMLKDFLSDNPNSNSCSSSGFKSLPRTTKPITNSIQIHHTHSSSKFQALIKTIKNNVTFFKITKQPSTILSLPRTLSRKLSSKRRRTSQRCKGEREIEIETSTVKIKDIIRWKSFRDIQQPSTIPSPPLSPFDFRRFVTESSTGTTATTCCGSSSDGDSSWSDGDFFRELWDAQNDEVEESGKKLFSSFFVGKDSAASFVGDKDDLTCQDEQHSPVSVLRVAENEFSIFDQSLANIEMVVSSTTCEFLLRESHFLFRPCKVLPIPLSSETSEFVKVRGSGKFEVYFLAASAEVCAGFKYDSMTVLITFSVPVP